MIENNITDNFDKNKIFYEYENQSTIDSSYLSTPFSITGVGAVTLTGDYSNSDSYGSIGYKFGNDKFLNDIKFVKKQLKNNIKNTNLPALGLPASLGDLQSKTDTNRIVFETSYGNIGYSQYETNSFTNTVTKDSYFNYNFGYEFKYNFGNNIIFTLIPYCSLSTDDAHSLATNFYLTKISKDKKTNSFVGLTYTKNFNTTNPYDVDSNIKFKVTIEKLLEGNKVIIGSYHSDRPTLKNSSASIDNLSSFVIATGYAATNKEVWWKENGGVDNWEIGWQ